MKFLYCKIRTHFKVWRLALAFIPKITCGSYVQYKGQLKQISSYHWVESCSIVDVGGGNYEQVPKSEVTKVQRPYSWLHDFKSGLRFYYGYWFDIWVNDLRFGDSNNHGKINTRTS